MMKNKITYFLLPLLVVFTINVSAQSSQLKNWAIPIDILTTGVGYPVSINFVPSTPVVNPLPIGSSVPDYLGAMGSYINVAHNSMHDSFGNLLFYIAENSVYDKAGDLIGDLKLDPSLPYSYLSSEIAIIPDIANCNKFYIVSGFKSDANFTVDYIPHYAILDMSLQNPNFPSNPSKTGKLQANSLSGTLFPFLGAPTGAFDLHSANLHIAVSKLRTVGGTPHRYIFVANALYLYRFIINASGITYDGSFAPVYINSNGSTYLRGEMELIENISTNEYKLALTAHTSGVTGYKIFTAKFDYTTGALISTYDIVLPSPTPSTNPNPIPHGIEFSPNGNYLYITHETSTSLVGNIKYFNFTTSTLTNLAIPSPANYKYSQIELGFGHMSGSVMKNPMCFISNNGLAYIADANVPTSAITYSNFTNNSTFLPDQIDGEIYFPTCAPITITGDNTICAGSSTTLTASGAPGAIYTWSPGGFVGTTITVAPGVTTTYTVVAVLGCCTSTASIKVFVDPTTLSANFSVATAEVGTSHVSYNISATPDVLTTWPATSFWWEICEVDVATGLTVLTPPMTNAQTWWYAPFIANNNFPGYNYTVPPSSWPVASPMAPGPSLYTTTGTLWGTNPAPGLFQVGHAYRITRATWGECVPWTTVSKYVYVSAPVIPPAGGKTPINSAEVIIMDLAYSPQMPEELSAPSSTLSINSLDENEIIISPNPSNGIFNISTNSELKKDIYIYDVTGKIVYQNISVVEKNITLNLSEQQKGIYIVRITDANSSTTHKIIIE